MHLCAVCVPTSALITPSLPSPLTPHQSHELDRLNQLRQAYIQRITKRMKSKSVDEDHISPGRREISFLERNLEELTRAHKRVRDTITSV